MGRAFRRRLRGLCASAVSFQNGMHKFNGNAIPVAAKVQGDFFYEEFWFNVGI